MSANNIIFDVTKIVEYFISGAFLILCVVLWYLVRKGIQTWTATVKEAIDSLKNELVGLRSDIGNTYANLHKMDVRLVKQEARCKTCMHILWDRREGKERRESDKPFSFQEEDIDDD